MLSCLYYITMFVYTFFQEHEIEEKVKIQQQLLEADKEKQLLDVQKQALAIKQQEMIEEEKQQQLVRGNKIFNET